MGAYDAAALFDLVQNSPALDLALPSAWVRLAKKVQRDHTPRAGANEPCPSSPAPLADGGGQRCAGTARCLDHIDTGKPMI